MRRWWRNFSFRCGRITLENYSRENLRSQVGSENPILIVPPGGIRTRVPEVESKAINSLQRTKQSVEQYLYKMQNSKVKKNWLHALFEVCFTFFCSKMSYFYPTFRSIGCTVFEMALRKPPWSEMQPMSAIFAIGSGSGPIPQLPEKFSRQAREFVNACLTR